MKRLTRHVPNSNFQAMMNFARAVDGRVVLAFADGDEDKDLCEYIAAEAADKSCAPTADEVIEGACLECDCPFSILYVVATQAAELHGRLKDIEDILGDDYDLDNLRQIIADASGP